MTAIPTSATGSTSSTSPTTSSTVAPDAAAQPAGAPTSPVSPAPVVHAQAHLAAPEVNPSFMRALFLGELREDLVFPFPIPPQEERDALRMVLETFREFAAASIDPRKHDRQGHFDEAVVSGMRELGMFGVNIPEEYGGFGASAMSFSRIFGEIGATDPALAVMFGAHQSIGCKAIILFGTEEQKRTYLPRCASGELIAGFCLTEPGSGSDAQAMTTTATPSEDGASYALNGTKLWISNAGYAGLFTVFARVPTPDKPKGRVTAFIVDAHAPGVKLGKPEDKMGIKASDTRAVSFENVRIPASDVIGEVGQGFKIALEVLNSGRLGLAAASSLATRRVMQEASAYAKQRQQFGRPIASFEMIRKKLAYAAADCYAADSAWMLTASMMDRGGIDYSLETAACKIFASELAYRVTNDALQIAGGIGYSREYVYEQAVRDARINLIFEGTNEVLRALIALSGAQEPGAWLAAVAAGMRDKTPARKLGAIGGYVAHRAAQTVSRPSFTRVHAALQPEAALVARTAHSLALAVEQTLRVHGTGFIERQYLQERMANAAIDLYLSTAVLSRATSALERCGGGEAPEDVLDLARVFVPMACRRARRSVRAMRENQDARLNAIAGRVVETLELCPKPETDV